MPDTLRIQLVGRHSREVFSLLKKSGVDCFVERRRSGVMNDAGTVVEIAKFLIPAAAGVVCAWLAKRPTRRLIITTEDREIINVEGGSVNEIEDLLKIARTAMIMDKHIKNSRSELEELEDVESEDSESENEATDKSLD
jgi:hypothetical protein